MASKEESGFQESKTLLVPSAQSHRSWCPVLSVRGQRGFGLDTQDRREVINIKPRHGKFISSDNRYETLRNVGGHPTFIGWLLLNWMFKVTFSATTRCLYTKCAICGEDFSFQVTEDEFTGNVCRHHQERSPDCMAVQSRSLPEKWMIKPYSRCLNEGYKPSTIDKAIRQFKEKHGLELQYTAVDLLAILKTL